MEVDHRRRWAAHTADDSGEEERVGLYVRAASCGGGHGTHFVEHVEGEREQAAARAAETEAGVEEPEVRRAGPREDVVDEGLGRGGAAAGRGRGERGEVGFGRVSEPRAQRGPAEEREREVRVLLGGDCRGEIGRGKARAQPRDPRRELLVRGTADGARRGGGGIRVGRERVCGGSGGEKAGMEEDEVMAAGEAARRGGEQRHSGVGLVCTALGSLDSTR